MSTDVMETPTTQQDNGAPRHIDPRELAGQVAMSPQLYIAIPRKGEAVAVKAALVLDGVAVQPFNDDKAEWRLISPRDFRWDYRAYEFVDLDPYIYAINMLSRMNMAFQGMLGLSMKFVGKGKRRKLEKAISNVKSKALNGRPGNVDELMNIPSL